MRESRVVALAGQHLCPLPRAAPRHAALMAPYAPPNVGNDPSTGSGKVSVLQTVVAAEVVAPASSLALPLFPSQQQRRLARRWCGWLPWVLRQPPRGL